MSFNIFCPFPELTPSHFQMFWLSSFHSAQNSLHKIQNLILQGDKITKELIIQTCKLRPNLKHPLERNGTLKLVVGIDTKMWMKWEFSLGSWQIRDTQKDAWIPYHSSYEVEVL